ncbi:MAG: hypothetical protein JG781_994 [Peptococcaceae bacterium]|jgi:hypothetical protein|nr:hypothetical protein [Peptococcaceae bacterium]
MAQCYFCEDTAIRRCGLCETIVCEAHSHRVNPWSNAYRAEHICEHCYQKRVKNKRVMVGVVLLFSVIFIASSMGVKWGFREPSMWAYFMILSLGAAVTLGIAAVYHFLARTGQGARWLKWVLLPAVLLSITYLLYKLTS